MTPVALRFPRLLVVLAAAVLFTACGSSSSSPAAPSSVASVPFSQMDLVVGTGATATTGRQVTVNYTGWLYNPSGPDGKGTQFDSSLQAGRTPLVFAVGGNGVITGFSQGVTGMRVGGQRRLVIPPSLGYGAQGNPPTIPPNATLVFDVELLSVS